MLNPETLSQLQNILAEQGLLTDPTSLETYGRDWTKNYEAAPVAIAFPKTTAQVQAIIHLANQAQFKLVPSGGRTGLSGGAVAAQGELVVSLERMNKILEFNTQEGTLGIITQATLQLIRPPQNLTVLVLGVPEFGALMQVLMRFQADLDLSAFEFFSDRALHYLVQDKGLAKPFDTPAPYYALLEFENDSAGREQVALQAFQDLLEQGSVLDGVMSQSQTQAKALWRLREMISETISVYTPYKNDLSVRVSQVAAFLQAVDQIVAERYAAFEMIWYGHIGDGNLHLNILKPATMEKAEFFEHCAAVNEQVFALTQSLGGSISAEHGVGLLKRDYLSYSRSPEEIAYMRAMKALFDPNQILNPGKLLS